MLEIRYALRLIGRNPLFSITVILILALCIGANTAVLSIVNTAMVRPLAYPEPDRLASVVTVVRGEPETSVDGWTWELVHTRVPSLDAAAYSLTSGVNMGVNGAGIYIHQQRVTSEYFRVMGILPMIGREFTPIEDTAGGPPVVVLGNSLWQKYFHSDPGVVGRAVLLRGEPYTVVGVMPAGFRTDVDPDLWTPLRPSRKGEGSGSNYGMVARLRPGISWQQASSQLALLTDDLRRESSYGKNADVRLGLMGLQEGITQELRTPLLILWAAVVLVFVLGCVNVGGMLLARATGRASEMATRLALGAPVGRIARQLLTESLILGLAGGIAGAALGWVGLETMRRLSADVFPFIKMVEIDWRVLTVTLTLTIAGGIAFGLIPALQAARVDVRTAQTGSRTVAGRRRFIPLGLLAGVQVALAIPLLIGAGLLLRTFLHLWNLNSGFDSAHVMTAQFSLQDSRYATSRQMNALFDQVLIRLRETPGIEAAAAGLRLPYERALNDGFQLPGEQQYRTTDLTYVTPEYFAALRIPLLQGRGFTQSDAPPATLVAVINQAFLDRFFKGQTAIGQLIRLGGKPVQIVGVVGNVLQRPGWGQQFAPVNFVPTVYVPAAMATDGFVQIAHVWFSPSWIVRSSLPGRQTIAAIENATRAADPLLPMAAFRSVDDVKLESLTMQRFLAALAGTLAALAILLTGLGIYGLISNLVGERTRELGIRLALGSTASNAIAVALRPGMIWVLAGVVVGAILSLAVERSIRSFLFGVTPNDPLTLVAVGAGLLLATALASLAPAARIVRLNPVDTLRSE